MATLQNSLFLQYLNSDCTCRYHRCIDSAAEMTATAMVLPAHILFIGSIVCMRRAQPIFRLFVIMTSCVCIFNENRQRCTGCMTIEIATDDMQLICLFFLCGYSAILFTFLHYGGYKIHILFNSRRKTVDHVAAGFN